MKIKSRFFLCSLLLSAFLFSSSTLGAAGEDIPSLPLLLAQIKAGGHILYIRHAPTERKTADNHEQHKGNNFSVDFADCSTQRNLSERGKNVAQALKEHLKRLEIPIAKVLSSPYCRARDTANIIFDEVTIDYDLAYSLSRDPAESKRLGEYLKAEFLAATVEQGNAVFVGHSTNLREGLGVWPKPEGVMAVFKIIEQKVIFKGMITPDDWQAFP
ncbi:MAG: histidine phosphatase family protein [Oceanospirillaceae bacterium]|nr:histidine phosphatase family protein [Oceanospirillaceae bacterium]